MLPQTQVILQPFHFYAFGPAGAIAV
jgi:hypothetical protein